MNNATIITKEARLMNEDLLNFLLNQTEHEGLDFKKGLYAKQNYEDLLKDVLAMANAKIQGPRYIVFGVKENVQQIKDLFDINNPVDAASYQELILENIEPQIICNLSYVSYQNKQLAILEITEPKEQPYLLKKQYGKLHKGFCYIRKGSKSEYATRADFDYYYKQGHFEILIPDKHLAAVNSEIACARLECSFRNCTDFPITIRSGELQIWDDSQVRSRHLLSGFYDKPEYSDFRMSIPPKTEINRDFAFSFDSSDCLKLEVNHYGYTDLKIHFKLLLTDTKGNNYTEETYDCSLFVKGQYLWKVK